MKETISPSKSTIVITPEFSPDLAPLRRELLILGCGFMPPAQIPPSGEVDLLSFVKKLDPQTAREFAGPVGDAWCLRLVSAFGEGLKRFTRPDCGVARAMGILPFRAEFANHAAEMYAGKYKYMVVMLYCREVALKLWAYASGSPENS